MDNEFEIGFWHPFGWHAGQPPKEIIEGKQKQIDNNGWTLWSFPNRPIETLDDLWLQAIKKSNAKDVFVFCSKGKGIEGEPKDEKREYGYYRPIEGENKFLKIPDVVSVKIPSNNDKNVGSAFIVKSIIDQSNEYEDTNIEWLEKTGIWREDKLPTRGQYLIRPGKGEPIREPRVILQLQYPYLAEMRVSI